MWQNLVQLRVDRAMDMRDGNQMIRKVVAAGLLALLVAVVAPTAAGAGQSDYAGCLIEVDPVEFPAGATVTVTGTNFQPNFETTIEFHSVLVVVGTVTTDATGSFETTVVIPADATPGPHTISALCDADGNTSETSVTVTGGGGTDGGDGDLPQTGSSSTEPLVVIGVIAVLAGIVFVVVARRRRRDAAA